jgi:cellulose synthase/poly-beta-1,6-N-acetylglucosamine synthase-like glycosyltransferase
MAGMARLGGVCHLAGTGMGFPWQLIDKVPWASGNVVEDMQLGIDYTLAGYPPLFVPQAQVISDLPPSTSGSLAQRRRWEHGFLQTALSQAPRLFVQAIAHRSRPLLWLALDLCVPPLALLSILFGAAWFLALLAWATGLGDQPLTILTAAGFAFEAITLLAWFRHCRTAVPIAALWQIPKYIAAKLPLYLEFLIRREQRWIRAERRG